jgi:protein-S-isoprenylcysteine O-methyltransferase Ste14
MEDDEMRWLLPPILFFLFILAIPLVCWVLGSHHLIKSPYNLVFGLPLVCGGLFLAAASKRKFRKVATTVMTFDKPITMVTDGFYAFSRNPMYLGFVIALFGVAISFNGAPSSLIIAVLFFVITDRWYIRYEERMMRDTFGSKFNDYCKQTRRWL